MNTNRHRERLDLIFKAIGRGARRWQNPNQGQREPTQPGEKESRPQLKPWWGLLVLVILAALMRWAPPQTQWTRYVPIAIGDARFYLEHASRPAELRQGLRFRPPLTSDGGMFFEMPKPGPLAITMRDVNQDLWILTLDHRLVIREVRLAKADAAEPLALEACHYWIEVPAESLPKPPAPGDAVTLFDPPPAMTLHLAPLVEANRL